MLCDPNDGMLVEENFSRHKNFVDFDDLDELTKHRPSASPAGMVKNDSTTSGNSTICK